MPRAAENKNIPPIDKKAAYPKSGKMKRLDFDPLATPYLPAAVPVAIKEICRQADEARGNIAVLSGIREKLEQFPNQRTYTKMVLRFVTRLLKDAEDEDHRERK